MSESSKLVPFPHVGPSAWIGGYQQDCLRQKDEATVDAYLRILRQFTAWVAKLPRQGGQGYSVSHRTRVKTVINGFCQWLIEEKHALTRNPTRGVEIKAQQTLAPRVLSPDQLFVLGHLLEKANDLRGRAIFALGYRAGCRVSDVAHLLVEHTHVGPKIGWLHVGHKGGKFRDIDVLNEARRLLYDYLQHGRREHTSPYVFTSKPCPRLTEDGIHQWFGGLKRQANHEEWEPIADLSFHDLRHDFAHCAREASSSSVQLAYYLGHVTMKGTPAIGTTVRYT